ncbi:uncharacterized protein LOC131942804 [Physella acuta]|uniref:uncharacterized protein LOC131942804 n=1 Tax=Physella acuta TaxID=109671 RepID=UPI0027DD0522|nr:uncharacterized protein LOC131942804 [Physella acuta]
MDKRTTRDVDRTTPSLSFEDNFLDISNQLGQPWADFTTSTYPGSAANNPWLPLTGDIPDNHADASGQNTGRTLHNLDVGKLPSFNSSVDNKFTKQDLDDNERVYRMPSGAEFSYIITSTQNPGRSAVPEYNLQTFTEPEVVIPVVPHIRNYVPLSILVTFLFSWLFGILAIQYSLKANRRKREKRYKDAANEASSAFYLNMFGIFWGIIGYGLMGFLIWYFQKNLEKQQTQLQYG